MRTIVHTSTFAQTTSAIKTVRDRALVNVTSDIFDQQRRHVIRKYSKSDAFF